MKAKDERGMKVVIGNQFHRSTHGNKYEEISGTYKQKNAENKFVVGKNGNWMFILEKGEELVIKIDKLKNAEFREIKYPIHFTGRIEFRYTTHGSHPQPEPIKLDDEDARLKIPNKNSKGELIICNGNVANPLPRPKSSKKTQQPERHHGNVEIGDEPPKLKK